MEFHFYGMLKMNKSNGSEGITYCLPGTGKGEIQSIQQSKKVSLGLTIMSWNKKKKSQNCTLLNNPTWAGSSPQQMTSQMSLVGTDPPFSGSRPSGFF